MRDAIKSKIEDYLAEIAKAREERKRLIEGDAGDFGFWPGEGRLREAFNEGAGVAVLT